MDNEILQEEHNLINSHKAYGYAKAAAIDVKKKDADARSKHEDFFNDPSHKQKVQDVINMVYRVFGPNITVYTNARCGRGRNAAPYITVKVSGQKFGPKTGKLLRTELHNVGLNTSNWKQSMGSNSQLFHVY